MDWEFTTGSEPNNPPNTPSSPSPAYRATGISITYKSLSWWAYDDPDGDVVGNIFVERLWRIVKYAEVYLRDLTIPREAHQSPERYFRFYNLERPHQTLDYRTPAGLYCRACPVQSTLISRLCA